MARIERVPILYHTPTAELKRKMYIELCKIELSGLGLIYPYGDDFLLTDVLMLEQTNNPAHTDFQEAAAKFLMELVKANVDPEPFRFWWHSHVNFGTGWSNEDMETINTFNNPLQFSMVANKRGDIRLRLDVFRPLRLAFEEIEYRPLMNPSDPLVQAVRKDILDKVNVEGTIARLFSGGAKEVLEEEYVKVPSGVINLEELVAKIVVANQPPLEEPKVEKGKEKKKGEK